mmetsp:Transcript_51192/g.163873  ORF Transcript_51192/g.163873 Transcript_51192/m.163873 type:complete len:216 (+) Transcript_51192:1145-1792(+)
MHPMVMLVGTMLLVRISLHSSQAPCMSFKKPYARTRLPKVWAPFACTLRSWRWRFNCLRRASAWPTRMQASHMELSRTSSIASSMSSTTAITRSTSLAFEDCWTLFRRMEQVTLFGCSPLAFISSMSTHAPSLLVRIVASMSSLKVTQFGAKLPPAARMLSIAARAPPKSPRRRCFLIIVLYVTTSAMPAFRASAMTRSAASKSWQSMQVLRRAL